MLTLDINGKKFETDAEPDTPLLWVLRDHLGMTGSKYGCGKALCGACTVHVDGAATRSCVLPVSAAASMKITTIEAVGNSAVGKAVQDAWVAENVPQISMRPCPATSVAARLTYAFVPRSSALPALWPEDTP
jgi:isoquinoline 1-oxidoreductase alpha subunit